MEFFGDAGRLREGAGPKLATYGQLKGSAQIL
jgi:hypothetical protein